MKFRKHAFSRTNRPVYQTTFFKCKNENPSFLEELRKLYPHYPPAFILYKRDRVPSMIMMILGIHLLNRTTYLA